MQRYPGRTAADLYVWIWDYIFEAHERFGEVVDPQDAAAVMETRAPSGFVQAVTGLMNRIADASRSLVSEDQRVPEWVAQTFEWDDGSLSKLADQVGDPVNGGGSDRDRELERTAAA